MATPTFKDHFSRQSGDYSRYRPGYPPELIAWVASRAPDRALAVDCATGNGQAAIALAVAEHLPVPDASVSLVAAAQAVHWFDFDRFHAKCRRTLKPGGAIAVWTYEKLQAGPAIDGVVDRFYEDVVGEYWPPERRSWSSVQRFKDAHAGQDPLPALGSELATLWPAGSTLRLNWPVHLRLGRA